MNYYPRINVPVDGGPVLSGSEVLYVDPAVIDGKATAGGLAIAGHQYLFPQPGTIGRFCVGLQMLTSDLLAREARRRVYNFDQLSRWVVSLRTPDGEMLHHQLPVTLLCQRDATQSSAISALRSKYFPPGTLFDPRQCYFETFETTGTGGAVLAFQLLYQ